MPAPRHRPMRRAVPAVGSFSVDGPLDLSCGSTDCACRLPRIAGDCFRPCAMVVMFSLSCTSDFFRECMLGWLGAPALDLLFCYWFPLIRSLMLSSSIIKEPMPSSLRQLSVNWTSLGCLWCPISVSDRSRGCSMVACFCMSTTPLCDESKFLKT